MPNGVISSSNRTQTYWGPLPLGPTIRAVARGGQSAPRMERNLGKSATKTGKIRKNRGKKEKLGRNCEACPCGQEGLATVLTNITPSAMHFRNNFTIKTMPMNANMANKLLNTKHMIHTSLQVKDTSILCSLSNMSDIGASMIRVTYGIQI